MLRSLLLSACVKPWKQLQAIRFLKAYRKAQEHMREKVLETDLSEHQIELACQQANISRAEAASHLSRWFEKEPLKHLAGLTDISMQQFIQRVKASGLALGVFSDYPPLEKLKVLGLDGLFDVVLCSSDAEVGRLKPDPRGLEISLRRLGVSADSAVYIGDRMDVDAECARAAGVHAIILGQKPETSNGVTGLRNYQELLSLFKQKSVL
jgi:HAD superfamily hydrolase (TIGR01509 family)